MNRNIVAAVVLALCGTDLQAQPTPAPARPELYRFDMIQAAPGKLPELLDLYRQRVPVIVAGGDEEPIFNRHSQGDRWDLLAIFPSGSFTEYYSRERIARREAGGAAEAPDAILPLSAYPREIIAFETRAARRHVFEAWRATTPETRAQGLMFVDELRADQAMIFVDQSAQMVAMWMKNTLLPLDMLFADASGCIVKLHEQARPGSLATIRADVPVALVVELKGGTARTLGIGVGDRVTRPSADWPRDARPCAREP